MMDEVHEESDALEMIEYNAKQGTYSTSGDERTWGNAIRYVKKMEYISNGHFRHGTNTKNAVFMIQLDCS
jgi:hypothetical protein